MDLFELINFLKFLISIFFQLIVVFHKLRKITKTDLIKTKNTGFVVIIK